MSGQSLPASQSARRVLGRCKNKGKFDSRFLIDVDDGSVDIIVEDIPETSQRRSRCFRAADSCPSGVINIDDEVEDACDAPRDVCGQPIGNKSSPVSSCSPACEEWGSEDCLMFANKGNFPQGSKKKVNMYFQSGPSRNRFGLGPGCEHGMSGSDDSSEFVISDGESSDTDCSDCEIIEDTSGDFRAQWERAAFRKKMSERGQYDFEDQVSASGSSADPASTQQKVDEDNCTNGTSSQHFAEMPVNSSHNDFLNVKENLPMPTGDGYSEHPLPTAKETSSFADFNPPPRFYFDEPIFDQAEKFASDHRDQSMGETSYCQKGSGTVELEISEPEASICNLRSGYETHVKEDDLDSLNIEEQISVQTSFFTADLQVDMSFEVDARSCMGEQFPSNPQTCPASVGLGNKEEQQNFDSSQYTEPQLDSHVNLEEAALKEEKNKECSLNLNQTPDDGHAGCEDMPAVENDLIGEREKHKESDEYRRAAEEEWASRQRELQIQAEEAQRLRKRRKTETLRLLDIERRQRQRLEEIRDLQKKDQETIDLKEQFRVEVRKELDKMEKRYRDMASLLRGLGIHVKGGPFPMTDEVNAAYKQALLRFHPDRATRKDIRQQVEAEETFKLISRLKEKLLPVA